METAAIDIRTIKVGAVAPEITQGEYVAKLRAKGSMCQGHSSDGLRKPCKNLAVEGSIYCESCGGNLGAEKQMQMSKIKIYRNSLGPTLKEFCEEVLSLPDHEQMRLNEEMSIVRGRLDEALKMRNIAYALPQDNQLRPAIIHNAESIVSECLNQVRIFAKDMAQINALSKDKFSAGAIQDVMGQFTRLIDLTFADCPEQLAKFRQLVETNIRLPQAGASGTLLTPDMDVQEMDATIPLVNGT